MLGNDICMPIEYYKPNGTRNLLSICLQATLRDQRGSAVKRANEIALLHDGERQVTWPGDR